MSESGDEPLIPVPGFKTRISRFHDVGMEENLDKHRNAYYGIKSAEFVIKVLKRWHEKTQFKANCILDAQRLGLVADTLYQKIFHGRKWALDYWSMDKEWMDHMTAFKLTKRPRHGIVILQYEAQGYMTDDVESAMSFGDETQDLQGQFLQFCQSDPPDGATWPANPVVLLSAADLTWFENAMTNMAKVNPPRFVMTVKGNYLKVTSIRQEDQV